MSLSSEEQVFQSMLAKASADGKAEFTVSLHQSWLEGWRYPTFSKGNKMDAKNDLCYPTQLAQDLFQQHVEKACLAQGSSVVDGYEIDDNIILVIRRETAM